MVSRPGLHLVLRSLPIVIQGEVGHRLLLMVDVCLEAIHLGAQRLLFLVQQILLIIVVGVS